MFLREILIVLALNLLSTSAKWPILRVKWFPLQELGFFPQPRTQAELDQQGWIKISSCGDGNKFAGDRYVLSEEDLELVLIFDGNGFIAGLQSVVPKDKTFNDTYFPFSSTPSYQGGVLFGKEVYFATLYFVDPSIICNGGRTMEEFESEGTGNAVYFQVGETISELLQIPLKEELDKNIWFKYRCIFNMGYHYNQVNSSDYGDDPCSNTLQLQLNFNKGNLNGLMFNHFAPLEGERYEILSEIGARLFYEDVPPPECLIVHAREGRAFLLLLTYSEAAPLPQIPPGVPGLPEASGLLATGGRILAGVVRNVEPNDIEENIERIANELNEDEEDPVNFPSVPVDMDALATLIENGADHVERNAAPLQRFIFSFFQG